MHRRKSTFGSAVWSILKFCWKSLVFVVKHTFVALRGQAIILSRVFAKKHDSTSVRASLPGEAKYVAMRIIDGKSGSWPSFEKYIQKSDSVVCLILGARGSGKTAFGMKLLENMVARGKNKACVMGFEHSSLPSWITPVSNPNEITNGSTVLVDEGGILFSSRDSMKEQNKFLSELIFVARHKNLTLFFITQNSSTIEVNVLRQADALFLKPSSLLQMDFERKKIKDIYRSVKDDFSAHEGIPGLTYVYSDKFTGFVANALPSFWGESVSKSFAGKNSVKPE